MGLFIAVLLFCLVSTVAAYSLLDTVFLEWFQGANYQRNGVFALTTDIGQSHWMLVGTGSILLFMSLYKFPKPSASHAVHWHHIFLKFYFVFTTIAFSGLAALALKNGIGRARPVFHDTLELWYSSPVSDPYMFASFPSGHSTTAGACAALVILLLPRFAIVGVAFALWVGVSRIMVGAHFPSDVVAGLAFGAVFTWIYARSFARKRLLFEFGPAGQLQLRDLSAKRARRKIRKNQQSLVGWGFNTSGTVLNKKA